MECKLKANNKARGCKRPTKLPKTCNNYILQYKKSEILLPNRALNCEKWNGFFMDKISCEKLLEWDGYFIAKISRKLHNGMDNHRQDILQEW